VALSKKNYLQLNCKSISLQCSTERDPSSMDIKCWSVQEEAAVF
jgi:hypothetical protein